MSTRPFIYSHCLTYFHLGQHPLAVYFTGLSKVGEDKPRSQCAEAQRQFVENMKNCFDQAIKWAVSPVGLASNFAGQTICQATAVS